MYVICILLFAIFRLIDIPVEIMVYDERAARYTK